MAESTTASSSSTTTPKGASTNAFGFSQLSGRIGSMQKSFAAMTKKDSTTTLETNADDTSNNSNTNSNGATVVTPPVALTESQKLQQIVKIAQGQHMDTLHVYQKSIQDLKITMDEFQQSSKATQQQLEQISNDMEQATQQLQQEEHVKLKQATEELKQQLQTKLQTLSQPTSLETYQAQLEDIQSQYIQDIETLEQQYKSRMEKIKLVAEKKLQEKFIEIQTKEQSIVDTELSNMNTQYEASLQQLEQTIKNKIEQECNDLLIKIQNQQQALLNSDDAGDIRTTKEFQQANKPLAQQVAEEKEKLQSQEQGESEQQGERDQQQDGKEGDNHDNAKEEEEE